jgi:peroxiredoxin
VPVLLWHVLLPQQLLLRVKGRSMKPTMTHRMSGLAGAVLALALTSSGAWAGLPTGKPAPLFSARTLSGKPFHLRDLRGQVVLLDFWAVGCPPCRVQMPRLQALQRKYASRGLRIIGVTQMDPTPAEARKALHALGVSYRVLLDPGERIDKQYQLEAHPTTVLIDRRGVVRRVESGFLIGDEQKIEAALVPLLARRSARAGGP